MNNVLNEASTSHGSWNNLSMQEKAAMIRVAVKNGLTDLKSIREKYNEFAGGGYLDWKEKAIKYKHLDIDNDRTYDYEGWYNENPQRAWNFLNDNPDAHFDDKYKTVYHPTFSTQSKYSGVVDPVFNPNGLVGGTWNKQGTVFTMSPDGYRGPVSMDERAWYLMNAEDNGVQLREADGSLPVFDGIPWGGVLPTVTVSGNRFAGGGKKRRQESISNAATQQAMKYFMGKGLTDYQAAGLVGNLFRESRLIPTATNAGSGAYGIAQWLGDRKKNLFAKYGKNPTLNQQLDYVWHELGNTHRMGLKAIKSSKNAEEAARNAMGYYEFSAGPEAAIREMRRWGQDGEGAMQKGINFASQLIGGPVVPFRAETPQWNNIPFTPANPEVFFSNPVTTSQPIVDMEPIRTPVLEYDPKEAERQEKRDNLSRFNMFLGMLDGSNESTFPFSMFAEGGKIHISPSKKGTFTAAASRHNTGVQEFASKVLANKDDYSSAMVRKANFARNASRWKHGLGGNLFEDGGPKKPLTRGDLRRMLLNRRAEAETAYNGSVTETQITPNDNAWVDKPLTRRKKNPHSSRRAEEGAKAHAAWEREHPNLAAWGNLAGAIPFAVAAAPLGAGIVAGGDALAATTAGQAITSGLAPLYQAATGATIAGAPALAWADAGLTSAFGAHGISRWVNGKVNGPLDAATTALEILPLGRLAKPLYESTSNIINSAYNKLPWTYKIPENPNMAYRRMGPLERDWLMEGNELSTRETNALTEAEEEAAKLDPKYTTQSGLRFNFFKAGAEHGGRKQFAKGQPWKGTTVTHGEEQVLAIPGKDLPWVSGRHFHGPQGNGFRVGDISFEEAPFGSHIDLLTEEGYTGVNPSLLDGSVIYSPYKILGRNFGYKKLYPKITTPQITAENAASITPEQWTAAQDVAIARGDMAEAQRLRDLHFQISAPNTIASVNGQPLQLYHGTDATFNAFDISKYGSTDGGTFGRGVYTTPVKTYAELYGKNNMPLYMKLDNPRDYRNSSIGDLIAEKLAFGNDFATGNGIDGVIGRPSWKGFKGLEEYVSHNPKNVKSSLPITYDDNGVRIPLGERDNFNINDIRYGLLPFGIGLTGYGLWQGNE